MMPRHRYSFAALTTVVVGGLAAYLLFPALFLDRSLVHADNLHHGFALLKFQHDVIHQGLSPLWSNMVYGGHALFAEGQAGLSNPINYLVAWLLKPELGHNLIHWLGMTGFGIGCFGLARTLSISPVSALFASLAATFSSLLVHSNTNMIAIEAMAWVPLTLWAFESWLRKPQMGPALLFGLTTSMLVFSGYPHFLHGTVMYMLFSATTLFSLRSLHTSFTTTVEKYWLGGALAILLCAGISSIQWLPLLELASLSHRQSGVSVGWGATAEYMLQGFLFSIDNVTPHDEKQTLFFPNIGSLLVCFLAFLSVAFPTSRRIKGHILATLILLNLGLGEISPLYRFAAAYKLIPGMDSFRIMFPYFIMSTVGVAILAASTLDNIVRSGASIGARHSPWTWLWLLIAIGLLGMAVFKLHTDVAPIANYVIFCCGLLGLAALMAAGKLRLYPLLACALLLVEILLLRVSPFRTIDNTLLIQPPRPVEYIKSTPNYSQFKHFHIGLAALSFGSPYSERLEGRAIHELNNLVASSNLVWGIPSFSAALALKSKIKPQTNNIVESEIHGASDKKPGYRVMDILSIKWVSKTVPGTSEHLTAIKDEEGKLLLWENPYARPLIQTYAQASRVDTPEKALQALAGDTEGLLYVEAREDAFPRQDQAGPVDGSALTTLEKSATRYAFKSDSRTGYWLFLADTFHPGWKATIDGQPTSVFPAQALGKAIHVPPGKHEIRLFFQPWSFRVGALLSTFTLLCLTACGACIFLGKCRENKSPADSDNEI